MKTIHLVTLALVAIGAIIVFKITTTGLKTFDGTASAGSHGTP